MIKLLIVFSIILGHILYFSYLQRKRKKPSFLIVSLFSILISINFSQSIFSFLTRKLFDGTLEIDRLGEFGNSLRIYIFFFIVPIGVFLGHTKIWVNKDINRSWLILTFIFVLISALNPYNPFKESIFIFIFYILQVIVVLEYIRANFAVETILKGIFCGLCFMSIFQFIITLFYPIMEVEFFATLFKDSALDSSLKRDEYVSAVGVFGHPGPLALYCQYSLVFFLACILNNYKKKVAYIALGLNIFIVLFTYSRTTYATCIIVLMGLYLFRRSVYKYGKASFLSIKNLFAALFGFIIISGVLFLTPLSSLFVESDFVNQIGVRLSSWYLGYQIWTTSPIIGVGINSHVYYMAHVLDIKGTFIFLDFLISNPIHNIHLVVLSETGIIGFFLWVYFNLSKIKQYGRLVVTQYQTANILNLTFIGVLISMMIYGLFGWSPLNIELLSTLMMLSYFVVSKKQILLSEL